MIRKSELAMLYFPESKTKKEARQRLNYAISKCPGLNAEIYKSGNKRDWGFTPRQVALILEFLGEP